VVQANRRSLVAVNSSHSNPRRLFSEIRKEVQFLVLASLDPRRQVVPAAAGHLEAVSSSNSQVLAQIYLAKRNSSSNPRVVCLEVRRNLQRAVQDYLVAV